MRLEHLAIVLAASLMLVTFNRRRRNDPDDRPPPAVTIALIVPCALAGVATIVGAFHAAMAGAVAHQSNNGPAAVVAALGLATAVGVLAVLIGAAANFHRGHH